MKSMLCLLLVAACSAGAQEMEESVENENIGTDDAILLGEELDYYRENPIMLGSATFAELSALPFLSPVLARKILDFRDSHGIRNMEDLLLIPGCDESLLRRLVPYVAITPPEQGNTPFAELQSRTQATFRSRVNSTAAGSPLSSVSRLKVSSSSMDAGISHLRGAGRAQAETDGYLRWSAGDHLPSMIAGDFVVHAGQGLVFAGSSRSGKTGMPDQVRRQGAPFAPRFSLSDPVTQRGVALQENFGPGRLLFFRSALFEGGTCEIRSAGVTVGGSMLHPLGGEVPTSAGVYTEVLTGGFDIFGELAGNSFAAAGGIAGFLYSPTPSFEITARVGESSRRYVNPLAHPFSESGNYRAGERGRTFGITVRPLQALKLSLVAGAYEYAPASSFGMSGREYAVRADVLPATKSRAALYIRRKEITDAVAGWNQTNFRLTLTKGSPQPLEFSERFEYTILRIAENGERQYGLLVMTDAAIRLAENRLALKTRIIIFQTDSYESRLYEYEENVRGMSAVPPLYGRGLRWYVLAECRIFDGVLLSARYAETVSWNQGGSRTLPRQVTFQAEAVF